MTRRSTSNFTCELSCVEGSSGRMGHNRRRMKRLVLTAALCSSMGCVKGVCYEKLDCPAPQSAASGVCILQDAFPTPPMGETRVQTRSRRG